MYLRVEGAPASFSLTSLTFIGTFSASVGTKIYVECMDSSFVPSIEKLAGTMEAGTIWIGASEEAEDTDSTADAEQESQQESQSYSHSTLHSASEASADLRLTNTSVTPSHSSSIAWIATTVAVVVICVVLVLILLCCTLALHIVPVVHTDAASTASRVDASVSLPSEETDSRYNCTIYASAESEEIQRIEKTEGQAEETVRGTAELRGG